ncbi:formate dehydrogenase subunit gamma [Chloroflexota bacterium]
MTEARVVERFKKRTIWFHWIHTLAFLVLIVTGAILFVPEFGVLAACGYTRIIHRITAIIFIGGPIIYFPFNPRASLHFVKETLTWGKNDMDWLMKAPDYYFGGDEENMPPQDHVNTGQKMWQLVVLSTGFVFLATGAIMWFLKETVSSEIFLWCQIVHDIAFVMAFLMLFVHIYLGIIHPRMTESLRSMMDGKISETYARHHYGKWYAKIKGDN